MKVARFRGRSYRIVRRVDKSGESEGCCDPPKEPGKQIVIDPNIQGINLLRVLLDEGIHACLWELDNDSVDEIAQYLALWVYRYLKEYCEFDFNSIKQGKGD